jgi:hypothetical protein
MFTVCRFGVALDRLYQHLMFSQIIKKSIAPQLYTLLNKLGFQQKVQFASTKPRHKPPDFHHHSLNGCQLYAAPFKTLFSLINGLPGNAKKLASTA